jgi:hypothetical protein
MPTIGIANIQTGYSMSGSILGKSQKTQKILPTTVATTVTNIRTQPAKVVFCGTFGAGASGGLLGMGGGMAFNSQNPF